MNVRFALSDRYFGGWNLEPNDKFVIGDFHKVGIEGHVFNGTEVLPNDFVTNNLTDIFVHNGWGTGMLCLNYVYTRSTMDWSLINLIDIAGTFVFAVSGIMVAIQKKFDFFGVIILAFVTAVGGGTLRDLMIGSTPVGWMKSEVHVIAIMSAIPICYFLSAQLQKVRRTFLLFDTLGIGLFTVLGIEKSLEIGLSPVVAVMMGIVSAVFGGVLRDVLSNDVPMIFRKEVYAFACFAGAITYLGLNYIGAGKELNEIVAISVVITIRILSLRYKWSIPFNPR